VADVSSQRQFVVRVPHQRHNQSLPRTPPCGRVNIVTPNAAEAASLLHKLLDALPDRGGRDTALRHRIQGAAIALEASADCDGQEPRAENIEQRDPFV
jgi:hypothetical protein